ncbi:hypothetical protein Fmac_022366 [Flemingia macrophylla]|uniref:Uncharacterized protein n=1 Tax=Flemingia macrophylla TaxID=520843 RepID=A0ABD1LZI0_9FABA
MSLQPLRKCRSTDKALYHIGETIHIQLNTQCPHLGIDGQNVSGSAQEADLPSKGKSWPTTTSMHESSSNPYLLWIATGPANECVPKGVTDTWFKPPVYACCKDIPPWRPRLPMPWDPLVTALDTEEPLVAEEPLSAPVAVEPISVAPSSRHHPRPRFSRLSLWMSLISLRVTLMQNLTSSMLYLHHPYLVGIHPLLDVDKEGEIIDILGSYV